MKKYKGKGKSFWYITKKQTYSQRLHASSQLKFHGFFVGFHSTFVLIDICFYVVISYYYIELWSHLMCLWDLKSHDILILSSKMPILYFTLILYFTSKWKAHFIKNQCLIISCVAIFLFFICDFYYT